MEDSVIVYYICLEFIITEELYDEQLIDKFLNSKSDQLV